MKMGILLNGTVPIRSSIKAIDEGEGGAVLNALMEYLSAELLVH